jgi:hypothetical protein
MLVLLTSATAASDQTQVRQVMEISGKAKLDRNPLIEA